MALIDGLLGSGPPDAGSAEPEDDLGYIGMSKGFVATRPGWGMGSGRNYTGARDRTVRQAPNEVQISPPRYEKGAEMEPRMQSPEVVARLQQQLVNAGLLTEKYRLGVWDSTSITAYKGLLGFANQGGIDKDTALRQLMATPRMKPDEWAGGGAGNTADDAMAKLEAQRRDLQMRRDQMILGFDTALHTYERSDPASVRQTAEAAFREALGRKPNAKELAVFTDRFMRAETQNQRNVFDAQDATTAGSRKRALQGVDMELASLGAGSGDPVDALLTAVGAQESGNDYNARNGRTGAAGKYQIMPSNWGPWAKEAGLGANAPKTAANQERVARFKMGQYVQEFGQQGAAVAWYAGPGAAKAWLENANTTRFNRKQGRGNEPSINEYVQQVTKRMGGGGTLPAAAAATPAGVTSESAELRKRLAQLIADAPGKVTPGPWERDYETQVKLYERYKAGKGPTAAKPGTSKHGHGEANDLTYENAKTRNWVLQNAARYGLAFPVKGENWHIQIAGSPGAFKQAMVGPGGTSPTAAPLSANVTAQRMDMGAQAVEFARTVAPVESKAYDIGGQFQSLLSILGRSVI